jgi:hypothetical protein
MIDESRELQRQAGCKSRLFCHRSCNGRLLLISICSTNQNGSLIYMYYTILRQTNPTPLGSCSATGSVHNRSDALS